MVCLALSTHWFCAEDSANFRTKVCLKSYRWELGELNRHEDLNLILRIHINGDPSTTEMETRGSWAPLLASLASGKAPISAETLSEKQRQ